MAVTTIPTDAEYPFLNMLNRLEGLKQNVAVLYLKLSALAPSNKAPHKTKALAEQIREKAAAYQISPFILSNQDIAFIGKNVPPSLWEEISQLVRKTFQGDRVLYDTQIDLVHLYYLERDYNVIRQIAQKREDEFRRSQKNTPVQTKSVPLAPEHLDAILRNIQGFNILKLIRRQEAIQIEKNGEMSGLFLEYFTSMVDLKKAIAPDVDVLSNRWLFQYLSETLDKRMLGISRDLFDHTPKKLSLNLNISTLFTPAFGEFLEQMPERLKVIVEVQLMDVMQNTKNFVIARDLLHETGNQILIDSLTPISFDFIDFNLFEPDLIKMNWPFNGLDPASQESLEKHMITIDPDKIVLMRVEGEEPLKWGLLHGISKFQGYYIDSLAGAACRNSCPNKKECTLTQCVACKARITGSTRAQCKNQDKLDWPFEKNLKR